MIGDGLDTDIAAARAVGARPFSCSPTSRRAGNSTGLPRSQRPDQVAVDAADLAAVLDRLTAPRVGSLAARERGLSAREKVGILD